MYTKKIIGMTTYISILRGINVGGQKKIQMSDLKSLYEGLNLRDVITYIQSGNAIFKSDQETLIPELVKRIESAISGKYNFVVPVIIRTIDEIKKTLSVNPFFREKGIDIEKLHVTFLETKPQAINVDNISKFDFSPDKFKIIDREVYLYCPNGYGISKLSNNFFENKLKMKVTTRNWKTINKLIELAGN